MKNLKLLWVIPIMITLVFTMCKKDQQEETTLPTEIEVTFAGDQVDPSNFKNDGVPNCSMEIVDYAKVVINGVEYFPEVFYLTINNVEKPYTQSIKLPYDPNVTYTVTQFLFMDDNQTPNDMSDDVIIAATPEVGSTFAGYISKPVPFTIDVLEFLKLEIPVEVICFQPDVYTSFGFDWFVVDEVTIREECFFGDLCAKNPNDYIGSLYAQQTYGLQIDMPAIAKIELYRNDNLVATFDNEDILGEGPLCVTYADYDDLVDKFDFKLFILVRDGAGFSYKHFKTWTIYDAQVIPQGSDGIVDYVLGMCAPDADYIFAPYMNLPATATYKVGGQTAPGSMGGYLDAILTNIPAGYEIYNGTYASWCFDHQVTITPGATYNMDVYSSLYPELMPAVIANDNWDMANWIMNHLDWYPGYTWADIQGAFWLLDVPQWNGSAGGGMPSLATLTWAQQMYDDAVAYGNGYLPLPGGWAAVIFLKQGTGNSPVIQTVFIVVDP